MSTAKLIALIVVFLTLVIAEQCAWAGEIELQAFEKSAMNNPNVRSWAGVQLSYQFDSPLYVFGTNENAVMGGFAYKMNGIGGGVKYKVADHISVFAQVGYYFIKNNHGRTDEFNEAIYYDMNTSFKNSLPGPYDYGEYWQFDEYEVINEDSFGGAIGVEIDYPIAKNWSIGINGAIHVMSIYQEVRVYRDEWTKMWPGSSWEKTGSEDFTSISMGLAVKYEF